MSNEKLKHKKLYAVSEENTFGFDIPLKKSIRIGKRDYEIQIKNDEKYGTYILWKNRRYPVEIVRSRQNRYEILFNDISYNFSIETPFSLQRKKYISKNKIKSDKFTIKAPMPGKIIDVLVKEGSEINRGESVVILEAMKMQNEIVSTGVGTVLSVAVKPGMIVMKDDILVELKTK